MLKRALKLFRLKPQSELALQLIREAKEKRLTRLDLGKCALTHLPDELFELDLLEELILANEWYEFEPEAGQWKEKKSSNNGAWNKIQASSGQIRNLTKLLRLIATGNRIRDIAPLASLSQLQSLYLYSNQISDLAPLASLSQLQSLDLRSNQISDLRPLKNLIKKGLPVSLGEDDYGQKIPLFNNPLTTPPKEIVEQGNAAILNYFKALDEQEAEPLNEAKLIIVGEPQAGKTT